MSGKGSVLVVPKLQVDQFFDLPDPEYQALMASVKKVAKRMKDVLQPLRVGIQVEGLEVPHVHYKVIAFDTTEQYQAMPDDSQPPDNQTRADMAKLLAF